LINILEKLHNNEISEDNAYDIYEKVMDEYHSDKLKVEPREELMLNNHEWTAFVQGADFITLSKWREKGWPKVCYNCKKEINYKEYNWLIVDNKLKCLSC